MFASFDPTKSARQPRELELSDLGKPHGLNGRNACRRLEIAHVLFIDIVGYSKVTVERQRAFLEALNAAVRGNEEFRTSDAAGRVLQIANRGRDGAGLLHEPEKEPDQLRLAACWRAEKAS